MNHLVGRFVKNDKVSRREQARRALVDDGFIGLVLPLLGCEDPGWRFGLRTVMRRDETSVH